jgi:hypothetical protein
MKKITLLLSFIACVLVSQAQTNLLTNPGFETWTNGTAPDGWTMGTATFATVSASTTLFSEGAKSFKVTAAAANGGTYTVSQIVPVTVGKTYTVKMSYYIETGDGTDARIWSDWCNVATTNTYATLSHADSVLLMGPGGGAAYFPDVKGAWHEYTCDVTAPATTGGAANLPVTSFSFQFRTYKTPAVVYWDNMYFGEKTTGLNSLAADKLEVSLVGNKLNVSNVAENSVVDVYSTLGAKVQTGNLVAGSIQLNDLAKGLYVVRVANASTKIKI